VKCSHLVTLRDWPKCKLAAAAILLADRAHVWLVQPQSLRKDKIRLKTTLAGIQDSGSCHLDKKKHVITSAFIS
jgi:hypothetical protein